VQFSSLVSASQGNLDWLWDLHPTRARSLQGNPFRCKTQICTKPIGVEVHLPQWFSVPILLSINENYPLQPPPKLGVKNNRWSKNPSNRLGMTPKHLLQSDFNDRQKLLPAATPKFGGKKIRCSKNPSNRLRMTPKRLPQCDFDIRQELHPAATRKAGDNKNRGRESHQIYIEWP